MSIIIILIIIIIIIIIITIIIIIITTTTIIIIIIIIIISITSFCAMPSAWKYKVCALHNGYVIQVIKEYDILYYALRQLRRLNENQGARARSEWDDVFVVIATRD
jgi:hypothetical protein